MGRSHANRGKLLENIIEYSNKQYKSKGLATIQKVPTPIKILKTLPGGKILGFLEKKSTVDFTGVYNNTSVAFDAKQTSIKTRFPLENVESHQIRYMESYEKSGGRCFLIVYFSKDKQFYFLPFWVLYEYWNNAKNGGRKSIPRDEFKREIPYKNAGVLLDYLQYVK